MDYLEIKNLLGDDYFSLINTEKNQFGTLHEILTKINESSNDSKSTLKFLILLTKLKQLKNFLNES